MATFQSSRRTWALPKAKQWLICIAFLQGDVARWMRSNRLQLNTAKIEVLWSTSGRRLHLLPVLPIRVYTDQVMPVSVVRNLGIYIDASVSMRSHVSKTVAACFCDTASNLSIRRSVPRSVLQSLVSSLVLQRLYYGNATLSCIPSHLTKRMQSVLNSAARLVFSATPDTAALAEGPADCSGVQMSAPDSSAVPC